MESKKEIADKFVNEISQMVENCTGVMNRLDKMLVDVDMSEEENKEYADGYNKLNDALKALQKFQKSYKGEEEVKMNTSKPYTVEEVKKMIVKLFGYYEYVYGEFYNKYLSYYGGTWEELIYDTSDPKTKAYINETLLTRSPVGLTGSHMIKGPVHAWCTLGFPIKSSDNPWDLVKNKEAFLEDVAQKYLAKTLPTELQKWLEADINGTHFD